MIQQFYPARSPQTSAWLVVLLILVPNDLQLPSQCAQVQAKAAKSSGFNVATPLIQSTSPKPRSSAESERVSHFDAVPSARQSRNKHHGERRFMWTQIDDMMDLVAQGMADGMQTMKRFVAPEDGYNNNNNIGQPSYRYIMPAASTVRYIIRKPVHYNMMPQFPPPMMYPIRRPLWYDPAMMSPQVPFDQNYKFFENLALQEAQTQQQSIGVLGTVGTGQDASSHVLVPNLVIANDSNPYNDWTPATTGTAKVLTELHTHVGPFLPSNYTTIRYDVTENVAEESAQHFNSSNLHVPNQRTGEQTYTELTRPVMETNQTKSVENNVVPSNDLVPAILANYPSNHQFYIRTFPQPLTGPRTPVNPAKLTFANAIRHTNSRGVLKFGDKLNKITIRQANE